MVAGYHGSLRIWRERERAREARPRAVELFLARYTTEYKILDLSATLYVTRVQNIFLFIRK